MDPPNPAFLAHSGGFFADVTVHDLDVARWLCGEVASVSAHGAASDPAFAAHDDIDTAVVVLRFVSGALGVIDNSRSARYGYECSTEVMGTLATARIDAPHPRGLEWRTPGAATRGFARDFEERYPFAYAAELDAFALCVRDGTPPRVTGRDAVAASDLATAATESWRTGRTDLTGGTCMNRIAGAPISWGVCEVPGWGYQLAPDRVLAEMAEVGLAATEWGPDGFLPADPRAVLAEHHLAAIGGFVPVQLHRPTTIRRRRSRRCSAGTPRPARTCSSSRPTPA